MFFVAFKFVVVVSVLFHVYDIGGGAAAGIAPVGYLLGLFLEYLLSISLDISFHRVKFFFGVEQILGASPFLVLLEDIGGGGGDCEGNYFVELDGSATSRRIWLVGTHSHFTFWSSRRRNASGRPAALGVFGLLCRP